MVTADGISREQANSKFWAVDKEGLLYERDVGTKNMDTNRSDFIRSAGESWGLSQDVSLLEVVKRVKPTVLIGCSTASPKNLVDFPSKCIIFNRRLPSFFIQKTRGTTSVPGSSYSRNYSRKPTQ